MPHIRPKRLLLPLFLLFLLLAILFLDVRPTEFDDDERWSPENVRFVGLEPAPKYGIKNVLERLGIAKVKSGARETHFGSLYELIQTSNPFPGAYYDERTSLARLRLTANQILGHGNVNVKSPTSPPPPPPPPQGEDSQTLPASKTPQRHILVTGGFGSLGKYVVRDLLVALQRPKSVQEDQGIGAAVVMEGVEQNVLVTILDLVDRTSELDDLLESISEPPLPSETESRTSTVARLRLQGKLRIVIGDVRNETLMEDLLAPTTKPSLQQSPAQRIPISGIVHLAAYSPRSCRTNVVDCENVETAGMGAILGALEKVTYEGASRMRTAGARPWLVVPRREDRWAEVPDTYNHNATFTSLLNSEALLRAFSTSNPLHSLLLRLPSSDSLIGDPHAPRFSPVTHLVESALGNLPIQVYTTEHETADAFLAIEDASESIVRGTRMLELAARTSYVHDLAFVAEVRIVGPPERVRPTGGATASLAQLVIEITGSLSPYANVVEPDATKPFGASEFEQTQRSLARKKASTVLGFSPKIPLRAAVNRYIASLLELQSKHLVKRLEVACATAPKASVLEDGLLALSGSDTQLMAFSKGAYGTFACSDGIKDATAHPLEFRAAVPFSEGVQSVHLLARRGAFGKVEIQLQCPIVDSDLKPTSKLETIVWAKSDTGADMFVRASVAGTNYLASWFTVDFTQTDARAFTVSLLASEADPTPPLLGFRDPHQHDKGLTFRSSGEAGEAGEAILWRVNPVCFDAANAPRAPWDFLKEDPIIASQVTYPSADGSSSLQKSTLAYQQCLDFQSQHDALLLLQKKLASPPPAPCDPVRGEADNWSPKDLPICSIDCSAPLVCFASTTCRCTRDRCGDVKARNPFPHLAYTTHLSYATTPTEIPLPSLVERVAQIPWDSVILPGARRAFSYAFEALPKAHVIDVPDTIDWHLRDPACYDVTKSPLPFMADHYLTEALRNRSVTIEKADFVLLPFYQGCTFNYIRRDPVAYFRDTVNFAQPDLDARQFPLSKVVIPFTHDFGSCIGWWPKLELVLQQRLPRPMDQVAAWQGNGDYNTRCVKPDRDTIIPAVTMHTLTLLHRFTDIANVTPVLQRPRLAFFNGKVNGFGAFARTRIGCGPMAKDLAPDSPFLYRRYAPGKDYVDTLASAKFCLLPRGFAAWTTRTFEVIYSGCIPVFIVDRAHFPFYDILDYSLFSVAIPENQAHRTEEILSSYDDRALVDLQANLVRVREAFIFRHGSEWERKGPLFFTLVSEQLRLKLGYPQDPRICETGEVERVETSEGLLDLKVVVRRRG